VKTGKCLNQDIKKLRFSRHTVRSTRLSDLSGDGLSDRYIISGDDFNGTSNVTDEDRLKESLTATKYRKKWKKLRQLGESLSS